MSKTSLLQSKAGNERYRNINGSSFLRIFPHLSKTVHACMLRWDLIHVKLVDDVINNLSGFLFSPMYIQIRSAWNHVARGMWSITFSSNLILVATNLQWNETEDIQHKKKITSWTLRSRIHPWRRRRSPTGHYIFEVWYRVSLLISVRGRRTSAASVSEQWSYVRTQYSHNIYIYICIKLT